MAGKPSVTEEQRGTVQLESSRQEELSIKRPWRARQTEVRPPGLGSEKGCVWRFGDEGCWWRAQQRSGLTKTLEKNHPGAWRGKRDRGRAKWGLLGSESTRGERSVDGKGQEPALRRQEDPALGRAPGGVRAGRPPQGRTQQGLVLTPARQPYKGGAASPHLRGRQAGVRLTRPRPPRPLLASPSTAA